MKREYNRPTIEKIAFDYRNQVVAASGGEDVLLEDPSNPYYDAFMKYGQMIFDSFKEFLKSLGII